MTHLYEYVLWETALRAPLIALFLGVGFGFLLSLLSDFARGRLLDA